MINLFYPEREIMVIRKIVREKKKKREDRSTPPPNLMKVVYLSMLSYN